MIKKVICLEKLKTLFRKSIYVRPLAWELKLATLELSLWENWNYENQY